MNGIEIAWLVGGSTVVVVTFALFCWRLNVRSVQRTVDAELPRLMAEDLAFIDQVEKFYKEVISQIDALQPPDMRTLEAMKDLGYVLISLRRPVSVEPLLREYLRMHTDADDLAGREDRSLPSDALKRMEEKFAERRKQLNDAKETWADIKRVCRVE